ncbi:YndM family protein [Bacillus sp. J33]|uniref:YndM family protein n=1 Tax=Bacillus sp. J33 TaxID=935836 RepID=UPI00047A8C9F|nr:YndM family protein [Bacillus sp. J33]
MQHVRAIAIKFIASLVLLYVILGLIYGMSFINVFIITAVLGIAAYVIGDLIILPRTGNTIATAADFGLAFLLIWFLSSILTYGENLLTMSLIAALGVALFEYFYHGYLARTMTEADAGNRAGLNGGLGFNTEASEELAPVRPDVRSEEDEK